MKFSAQRFCVEAFAISLDANLYGAFHIDLHEPTDLFPRVVTRATVRRYSGGDRYATDSGQELRNIGYAPNVFFPVLPRITQALCQSQSYLVAVQDFCG